MNNKLYVGNLSFGISEEALSQAFQKCGTVVSTRIITDKFSGRSKGFAFVEMSSGEEGAKAIADLNGMSLDGRQMNVSEAKPAAPRENNGRSSRPSFGNRY